jgi:hypothetical protein
VRFFFKANSALAKLRCCMVVVRRVVMPSGMHAACLRGIDQGVLRRRTMKFCYFDESGTGAEPVAVVVGVVVDAQRMHVTKQDWEVLLANLSAITKKPLAELHTKDFYSGKNDFSSMPGPDRAKYIGEIISWFADRKHAFVHSAVDKAVFEARRADGEIHPELETPWRAGAFHCVLALQRAHQSAEKNKGHTVLVLDNKGHEEQPFAKLVCAPPAWSDSYYDRGKKQARLDQIIDAPYFADSRQVPMIQVADFLAYFLRRYVELTEGHAAPKYDDEVAKVSAWVKALAARSIGSNHIYPARKRCATAELFHAHCPSSLRRIDA